MGRPTRVNHGLNENASFCACPTPHDVFARRAMICLPRMVAETSSQTPAPSLLSSNADRYLESEETSVKEDAEEGKERTKMAIRRMAEEGSKDTPLEHGSYQSRNKNFVSLVRDVKRGGEGGENRLRENEIITKTNFESIYTL